ncbi:hypothetical protein ACODT5_28790 [Streptomyces sp. 5.8]|uniref:hypothetical protein n=1 Tax=Streptomyces sp. 5.8 TaxID=3406571 RepID=UPI003BB516F5
MRTTVITAAAGAAVALLAACTAPAYDGGEAARLISCTDKDDKVLAEFEVVNRDTEPHTFTVRVTGTGLPEHSVDMDMHLNPGSTFSTTAEITVAETTQRVPRNCSVTWEIAK